MKIFIYSLAAITSWTLTAIAYLFAPIICAFADSNNRLPKWLSWFGTPDNLATGDPAFWPQQHPTYSPYKLAVTWMWRNPAQGFDQWAKADVAYNTPVDVRGNIYIHDGVYGPPIGGWFLITAGGYFQFQAIIPTSIGCFEMHSGWSLKPLAAGYEHPTLGALLATPVRFFRGH
jgi:hypothetical protein